VAPVVAGVDLLLRHDREADAAVAGLVCLLRADRRSHPWVEAG
jgi:hypothetical protein